MPSNQVPAPADPTDPTASPLTAAVARPPADARLPAASRLAGTSAAGLTAVLALFLLGVLVTGFAYSDKPRVGVPGDVLHRIGYAAASVVDLRVGVALLVALALVVAASLVTGESGDDIGGAAPSTIRVTLIAIAVLSVLVIALAPLAVRVQLHVLDLSRQKATGAFRIGQATYAIGTMGTAAVALVGSVFALRPRR